MLLSAVSVLVVTQSSSEIPEGLMNNLVYRLEIAWHLQGEYVVLICMKCVYISCVKSGVEKTRAPDRRRDN